MAFVTISGKGSAKSAELKIRSISCGLIESYFPTGAHEDGARARTIHHSLDEFLLSTGFQLLVPATIDYDRAFSPDFVSLSLLRYIAIVDRATSSGASQIDRALFPLFDYAGSWWWVSALYSEELGSEPDQTFSGKRQGRSGCC